MKVFVGKLSCVKLRKHRTGLQKNVGIYGLLNKHDIDILKNYDFVYMIFFLFLMHYFKI